MLIDTINEQNMLENTALGVLIICLFLLLFGLYLYVSRNKFERSGIKVNALINEIIAEKAEGRTFYYPVVSFSTLTGKLIKEQYPIGSYPSLYQKGEEVEVMYVEEATTRFIIVGKKSRYLQTILILVGAIGVIASAVYLLIGI